ncbi:hypothetical protein Cva_00824 [Caedimonas varicaedens]|uniref:Uncharacterized protein n=1 Tax=Caedimonas varicaedens TaxID=1629334 RepID=A0A0K8MCD2_9PROT|nr:hypothetical protein Cva_00824 [Caedimonas varicaedens]
MAFTKWLARVDSKKLVLVGNGLEFFDLYLYIHLAHVINQKFFPYGEPSALRMLPYLGSYLIAPISCISLRILVIHVDVRSC